MPRKSKHAIPEEKKALLMDLIETYSVKTTADLQEALKDLLGETIQTMLEQEIDTQIDEREAEDSSYSDSRNGYKDKTLRSSYGEIPIQVPQDRNSDFEPKVVPKYQRDISEIEGKIIGMYARGMSTSDASCMWSATRFGMWRTRTRRPLPPTSKPSTTLRTRSRAAPGC